MANFNNSHAEAGRGSDNIHAQVGLQRDNMHTEAGPQRENMHTEAALQHDNMHTEAGLQRDNIRAQVEQKCELGILICKVCGQVIDTLPTNGVKKIYGVCSDADCKKINGGEKR